MSNPNKPQRTNQPSKTDRDTTPRPERDTGDRREYGGTPNRDTGFEEKDRDRGLDRGTDRESDEGMDRGNRDVERERDSV